MSGKFRRSQRHQRWNDEGTCWNEKYLYEITVVEADADAPAQLRNLASELRTLSRTQYTFGELEELRRVLAAFQRVAAASSALTMTPTVSTAPGTELPVLGIEASGGAPTVAAVEVSRSPLEAACWLLSGLLFQAGSRPLHRTVLGAVKRLAPAQLDVFGTAVTERLRVALADMDAVEDAARNGREHVKNPSPTEELAAAGCLAAEPQSLAPASVPLGEVLASLLWLPASHAWVRPVVAAVVWRLAIGVDGVLEAADRGLLHIAPGLMEEVLDAVGALYYLLQHHGPYLVEMERQEEEEEGEGETKVEVMVAEPGQASWVVQRGARESVVLAGRAMLRALQGRALVREALASAAVVLWAASLLPDTVPGAAAAAFGQGLFFASSSGFATSAATVMESDNGAVGPVLVFGESSPSSSAGGNRPLGGWLDGWFRNRGSSLVSEITRFSPIGRICSLKGLVTAMPKEATCAQLWVYTAGSPQGPRGCTGQLLVATSPLADMNDLDTSETVVGEKQAGACRPWHFLIDGALTYGCSSIRDAPDAHFKYHAACVLCFCISKVLDSWQQQQRQQQVQEQPKQVCDEADSPRQLEGGGGGRREVQRAQEELQKQKARGPEATEALALQPALLHPDTLEMLMGLMWANLDEPLAQTARQLQEAFQHLLEVLACQEHYAPGVLPPMEQFKRQVVAQLLAVPPNRKGRYASLGFMAERGFALEMLRDHPSLIPEALLAMQSDTTASVASSFLKTLLAAARTEASAKPQLAAEAAAACSGGSGYGDTTGGSGAGPSTSSPWVALWSGALLRILYGSNEKLRAYVSVHALPVVLGLEPASSLELIHATLADTAPEPVPGTSRVAALVAVLKAARGMGLVADLDALVGVTGQQRLDLDPEALLIAAVGHASEAVRLDALELACVSFKMSDPPGRLELSIAGRWLALCMRSTAQGSRNKCLVLVTKLIARIRMAVAHIHNKMSSRGGPAHPSSSKGKGVQVLFSLGTGNESDALAAGTAAATEPRVTDIMVLERLQSFMQWLTRLLVSGLYPGSPYERRFFALELLSAVLEAWGPDGSGSSAAAEPGSGKAAGRGGGGSGGKVPSERQHQGGRMAESTSLTLLPRGYNLSASSSGDRGSGSGRSGRGPAATSAPPFRPYCLELLTSNTVALLLAGAVDSWDKLRQAASSCLMRLPTPLPGLSTGPQLTPLLAWATGLLWSPRARESDAGARLIKILYAKYVAGRGWQLQFHPSPRAVPPSTANLQTDLRADRQLSYAAVLDFLDAVLDLVNSQVASAREDLSVACRRSLAHGPLLLLRYVIEDVPWAAVGSSQEGLSAAADWAARALTAAEALVDLALPVLSRPQERNVGAEEVGDGGSDGDVAEGGQQEEGEEEDAGAEGDDGDGCGANLGPEAQVVITACWTTVKEVSLVLATMIRHMPLPTAATPVGGANSADCKAALPPLATETVADADNMLSCEQLRRVGELLVRLLFEMKHNGAVDKTSLALTAVSERLLRATALEVNCLPRPWMEACIRRVLAPGQSRDDIVRRSAGLPFALGALFLAEPSNAPKTLLSRGMNALLAVAAAATSSYLMTAPVEAADGDAAPAEDVVTVEGYEVRQIWPVVHAFNCLRHAFNDGHLAVDTSGYFAPAIQACLHALRSPAWEIRNSAMLCFTSLTARVLGFKNDTHGESHRKAVSGTEFFQRYPALHGFLLAQLREAATELEIAAAAAAAQGGSGRTALALAKPHPGLYPVLIILSRLKASHIRDDAASSAQQEQEQQAAQEDAEAQSAAVATAATAVATYMGALTPVAFTPLVRRCATAAPYAVRRLAAQALGPLVAAQDAPTLLQQLLAALPPEPRDDAAVAGPGGNARIVGKSSNALHGALLQSAALLETAAMETRTGDAVPRYGVGTACSSPEACRDMLTVALPPLARGAWLADPRFRCSAMGCALFQAASAALRLVPPGRCLEFRSEVAAFATVCRKAVDFEPPAVLQQRRQMVRDAGSRGDVVGGVNVFATDFPDPMRSQLIKKVVQLWLGPLLMCQAFRSSSPAGFFLEGLLQRLRTCLASYLYDTRAAALKSLVGILSAVNRGTAALSSSASLSSATVPLSQGDRNAGNGAEPSQSPTAAVVTSAFAASSGITSDAGGKLPRLIADLLSRPALMRRLVSEGMALLWEAVASESIHKVTRRALKALGLLHTLSTVLPSGDAISHFDSRSSQRPELDPTTTGSVAQTLPAPLAAPTLVAVVATGRLPQHPVGCTCCTAPQTGGKAATGAAAAAASITAALNHVALVQRLLTTGCKELEARCEALRCLGRALGSAMLAAANSEGQLDDKNPAGSLKSLRAVPPPPLLAALGSLLVQVATAAQPWQPEDWRLAGAEALAASRLLQSAVGTPGLRIPLQDFEAPLEAGRQLLLQPQSEVDVGSLELLAIRGWRCVIAFLEDEDHSVRYIAARLAQEVMELATPPDPEWIAALSLTNHEPSLPAACGNTTSAGTDNGDSNNFNTGADRSSMETKSTVYGRQPLYVEAIIRRVYSWLAAEYGPCGGGDESGSGLIARTALLETLCELVSGGVHEDSNSGTDVPEVVATAVASAGATAPVGWSSQARKLFDKEADNPHEEPLLAAQLAARTLRALLAASSHRPQADGDNYSDRSTAAEGVSNLGSMASAPVSTAVTLEATAALTAAGSARLARWGSLAAQQLSTIAGAIVAASCTAHASSDTQRVDSEDGDGGPTTDGWLGGFVNHPEVFTCTYKALLVLWTLGPVRQQLLTTGFASSDSVASALSTLWDRHDVRVSQLASLLQAVGSEWAGGGLHDTGHGETDDSKVKIMLSNETPQESKMLFLL